MNEVSIENLKEQDYSFQDYDLAFSSEESSICASENSFTTNVSIQIPNAAS